MFKNIGRWIAIFAMLVGIVGSYFTLQSKLSQLQQVIVMSVIATIASVVVSFWIGYEFGQRGSGHDGEEQARRGQRAISHETGVLQVFRRREGDTLHPLSERIKASTSDIFFLGLSLPKLDSYTGALLEKAQNQVHVRLLVPDPCEKWLVQAIGRFLHREEPYPQEMAWFFRNFYPVWKQAPVYFEVRVHRQLPTLSASVFDARRGNIEMYVQGVQTDERPILEMDFARTAAAFRQSLDRLWAEALPLATDEQWQQRMDCSSALTTA